MELSALRQVYEGEAPFATVYLEGRSPAEGAQHQVRLRWHELRERLEEHGATEEALSSLDDAIVEAAPGEIQANGRVLVADAKGVVLDEAWDAALEAGDMAHLTDEPHLGAYVRERERAAHLLVAVTNQHGAVIRREVVSESHDLDTQAEGYVGDDLSDAESVSKPRGGALLHQKVQLRADEIVKQNVRGVAEKLATVAKEWRPDLVVLAGEVQGRTALREELPSALPEPFVEVDAGGVSDESAEEALEKELRRIASDLSTERSEQTADRFCAARSRDLAVEGPEAVARALELGAVETLLLEYDRTAEHEPELLAASVRTDADIALTIPPLEGAVAALLRFEVPQNLGK